MARDLKINTSSGALGVNNPKINEKPNIKHAGGRKKKIGPKNENFTISMDPILYEKYLLIAQDEGKSSISEFFRSAVKEYCKSNDIDLNDEKLNEKAIENYNIKKESRKNKSQ